jgi:hypothetical protein
MGMRGPIRGCGLLLGLAAGCLNPGPQTALVPSDPFATPPVPPTVRAAFAPADVATAARVDTVGRQLLAANPQTGLRPQFRTIGAPQPELFHQGTVEIDITEGLAKQCATDGQLAALLAHELAKMVAEREALAGPQARLPERPPPMAVPVGNDSMGGFGAPDQTHLAELGMYEREQHRPGNRPPPLPDAKVLSRTYLTKAGYPESDLEAVQQLLQAAADNNTFARQLKAPPTTGPRTWTR